MKFQHSALLAIILVIGVGGVPMIAAAEASLPDDPEYSGGDDTAEQAITTTVTLSAEGSQITDVTTRISEGG